MEDCNVDSLDGRTEEDKTPVETNRKRKIKTPAQLEALEEYYEDHKYPTESMKSAIAEKIGLTEKQVSGWFCHRRLKDKRLSKDEALGNGRMDRSSGIIQEHCSGPGQDSCGSTKPGEYADLREVESQWLTVQEFSPKNLSHHNRLNTVSLEVDMDDTSSESSLPLRPSHMPQLDAPQMWENSRYLIQNGDAMPSNPKVAIGAQLRRPSGYLKIKPKAEHPAIAAVKRQLGNSFREDGPPIGIEFHPLPIDAFQAAPKDTTTGPANGIDSLLPNIPGSSYHGARSRFEMCSVIFKPDHSYLEEEGTAVNHGSEVFNSHRRSRPLKPSFPNNIKFDRGWKPSPNSDEEYAQETYSSQRFLSNGAKYGSNGLHIQPISSDHISLHEETLTNDQTDVSFHNLSRGNPKISQKSKHLKNQLSNTKTRLWEPDYTFKRRLYTREPEFEKHFSVSSNSNTSERRNLVTVKTTPDHELMDKRLLAARNDLIEYPNPPRERISVANELKDRKMQVGDAQPDFTEKMLSATNLGRRAAGEVPSSFSEDEAEETSSSGNDE